MQILIDSNVSLDDLDKYYGYFERASDVDATIDFILPKKLANNFVGLVPAIYQLAITWIRYRKVGNLLLDIEYQNREDLESLYEHEHLFPIIILAWNKTEIFDITGNINLKTLLREPLTVVRKMMLKVQPLKGRKLLLTSIDHFPTSSGLLPCFETPNGFINNENNTYRNLNKAIDEILNLSFDSKTHYYEIYKNVFIAIIHELVKNTYEWGKSDQNNILLDPSIRGILVKFYKKRRTSFISEFKMHKGLSEYFANQKLKENSNGELYFLEISVYDSGVGFVNKYKLANKIDFSETDIIKKCLVKHMTSSAGLEKDDRGMGLDRILNLLDKKGFLRIKTHKSCLYRNLVSHPYKVAQNENNIELFDWNTQSDNTYTDLPLAAGSTLTILYPLGYYLNDTN